LSSSNTKDNAWSPLSNSCQ